MFVTQGFTCLQLLGGLEWAFHTFPFFCESLLRYHTLSPWHHKLDRAGNLVRRHLPHTHLHLRGSLETHEASLSVASRHHGSRHPNILTDIRSHKWLTALQLFPRPKSSLERGGRSLKRFLLRHLLNAQKRGPPIKLARMQGRRLETLPFTQSRPRGMGNKGQLDRPPSMVPTLSWLLVLRPE